MRPSQQKNRMRGRGRKQPNPLSRNYESNGPDVKIRGNAAHIAEKYATLARDSAASGDRVIAENYLQHAEHYNRIIAAATAASSRNEENTAAGRGPQPDVSEDESDDDIRQGTDQKDGRQQAVREDSQHADDGGGRTRDGEDKPRREGRSRRPRPKNADGESGEQPNGAAAANGGGEDGSRKKSEMTDDAAKLPGNLLGIPDDGKTTESGASRDD